MSNFNEEKVLSVHHWTETLFSFTTTRDPGFRFENGQFTMIGLPVNGRPLLRDQAERVDVLAGQLPVAGDAFGGLELVRQIHVPLVRERLPGSVLRPRPQRHP